MIEISGNLFMLDFKVRQRGMAAMAPVDDVVALINQAFVIKLNKNLSDSQRQSFIHRKTFPLPVAGCAQALELMNDGAAGLLSPFPYCINKPLPTQLVTASSFRCQLLFHHILSGNAGMVRAGHPENIVAFQSVIPAENVLKRHIQRMSHVKDTRDIGRGDDNRITGAKVAFVRSKKLMFFPESIPAFFDILGFVSFIRLIHKRYLLLNVPSGIVIFTPDFRGHIYKIEKGDSLSNPQFRTITAIILVAS